MTLEGCMKAAKRRESKRAVARSQCRHRRTLKVKYRGGITRCLCVDCYGFFEVAR